MVPNVRALIVALQLAASFLVAGAAHAQPIPSGVLVEPMPASKAHVPGRAKVNSGLVGKLNPEVLSAHALEVSFADGYSAIATAHGARGVGRERSDSWSGAFDDSPGSLLVLTRTRGVVAGFASYEGRTFELLPTADGRHVLFEVDAAQLPQGDVFETNLEEARRAGAADALTSTSVATPDPTSSADALATTSTGTVVHDVLIYYTAAAASKWGQATLESMVRSAVQSANLAYQNSQARVALNVVAIQPSPVREGSSMSATVRALQSNSTARAARDNFAADMVLVMAENADVCGFAQLWYSWSGSTTNWDAYAGAQASCLSTQVLAHEIAHLQQLDHNIEHAAGFGPYPYSYGYRVCTTGGFRDIMSYPCSMNVARINYFSNPNLTYNGYALGKASSADGARSLNETAAAVAAYRVGAKQTVSSPPSAPTSLVAASVRYDRVSLSWKDSSTNETGFKVQRSKDGVNFSLVATLSTNVVSFVDAGVLPATAYYYRVYAYNGAGTSVASNVLSVKTPTAVPAAPASVAAANGGNGNAIVTWADRSNNETRFEIRRAKWDAAAGKWLSAVHVGTVGANVTRFVNSCGRGKFRFHVRAANDSGRSAFAGPAVVTVTGG